MDLVTPGIGMIFWSTLTFLLLIGILAKYAWRPILKSVNAREESIRNSLESAENAKKEMQNIKAENDVILRQARKERDEILSEAKKIKNKIVDSAKEEAKNEVDKLMKEAKINIQREKEQSIKELKTKVADLSITIAENILKEALSKKEAQFSHIANQLKDIHLN